MGNLNKKSLRHKFLLSFCWILLTIINVSCQKEQVVYFHFHELKNAEWKQNDTLIFDIDSASFHLNVPYTLNIEVTNNVNYPYQNIWFFVQSNIESDSVFIEQSKEYKLADESGKWEGSGFASLYQNSFLFDNSIIFREKRNYRIKVEHGMRDEPLVGIEKIGLKIVAK